MAVTCFQCVQYVMALMVILAFNLIVTAGVVRFWWITGIKGISRNEMGLWRDCTVTPALVSCNNRDIFTFDEYLEGRDKDIILAGLVGSALFSLVAFVFALIAACQRFPKKCLLWFEVIFTFVAAGGTLFGIVWGLLKIGHSNAGWAFYCVYGAAGLLIFSFIFSAITLTMRLPGTYPTHEDETVMLQHM